MHEGHRKRMISKLLSDDQLLTDHELLEILLFYAVPRKNVNGTAHNLLDAFGTLENVMSSDADALIGVEGVGERTAAFIVAIEKIYRRMQSHPSQNPSLISYDVSRRYLIDTFRGLNEEKFIALFLNKQGYLVMRKVFSSHSACSVDIDLTELQKGLAAKKPYSVIIAHNHLSGSPLPSLCDDETTEKLTAVLRLNGVILNDHIIVSGDKTYSYSSSGKMDKYKRNVSLYFNKK